MDDKAINCEKVSCSNCADLDELGFDFTMAFQPIINCKTQSIYGYEIMSRLILLFLKLQSIIAIRLINCAV